MALQPHPMTSVMQLTVTAAALCVAASAIIFTVRSTTEERNAKLVEIGVGILRVDPAKDGQIAAARNWALDLIDANAGGVKFSKEARAELLSKRLDTTGWATTADSYSFDGPETPTRKPPHSN
jgi:hypothetical protein